jgi:hypothetical protein
MFLDTGVSTHQARASHTSTWYKVYVRPCRITRNFLVVLHHFWHSVFARKILRVWPILPLVGCILSFADAPTVPAFTSPVTSAPTKVAAVAEFLVVVSHFLPVMSLFFMGGAECFVIDMIVAVELCQIVPTWELKKYVV